MASSEWGGRPSGPFVQRCGGLCPRAESAWKMPISKPPWNRCCEQPRTWTPKAPGRRTKKQGLPVLSLTYPKACALVGGSTIQLHVVSECLQQPSSLLFGCCQADLGFQLPTSYYFLESWTHQILSVFFFSFFFSVPLTNPVLLTDR